MRSGTPLDACSLRLRVHGSAVLGPDEDHTIRFVPGARARLRFSPAHPERRPASGGRNDLHACLGIAVVVPLRASIGAPRLWGPARRWGRSAENPTRHRQPTAQHGELGRLREVAARGIAEDEHDLLGRYRMPTPAAAEAQSAAGVPSDLSSGTATHQARSRRPPVPPGERGTVGSWTTTRAPPSRSADHVAVPGLTGGTATRSQLVSAGSSATSAATRRSTPSWTRSTHETSATVSSASAQSISNPVTAADGRTGPNVIVTTVPRRWGPGGDIERLHQSAHHGQTVPGPR